MTLSDRSSSGPVPGSGPVLGPNLTQLGQALAQARACLSPSRARPSLRARELLRVKVRRCRPPRSSRARRLGRIGCKPGPGPRHKLGPVTGPEPKIFIKFQNSAHAIESSFRGGSKNTAKIVGLGQHRFQSMHQIGYIIGEAPWHTFNHDIDIMLKYPPSQPALVEPVAHRRGQLMRRGWAFSK